MSFAVTATMIIAAIFLVILNGLFVAAEFAFVKVRSTRLEILAQEGNLLAKYALFGIKNLDAYLSVCQLGITLASLGLGWLGEPAVSSLLRPLFEFIGLTSEPLIHSLSVIIGFAIITFAHVTFGELAPKTISIRSAETTVLALALPMRFFYLFFYPAVKMLNATAQFILRLFYPKSWKAKDAHSTDELKMLIAKSKEEGHLDENEERLLNNIFNLDKRVARDIMVHRTNVFTFDIHDTVESAIELVKSSGHTRFPLYDTDKDNIIGFFHAKDLLDCDPNLALSTFVRTPLSIYNQMPIDDILEQMQKKKQQFGFVWDEYGIWQGLITLEDIIESIVGNIEDEFDHDEPPIIAQNDGSFLVLGSVSLDQLKTQLNLNLGLDSEDHYRPISTLMVEKLGEIPNINDTITINSLKMVVNKVKGHTIKQVKVYPIIKNTEDDNSKAN